MQVFQLESRLLVIGRGPSKDISIPCEGISREHATLMRVPSSPPSKYEYRLIEGGPSQHRSTNGTLINGKSAYMHVLEHGDMINFAGHAQGLYLKVELTAKNFQQYLAIVKSAKDLDDKTRNKIVLMTRVFDKLSPYLSKPDNEPSMKK
jgi:pSer/pThr/pTyr-binding forkhead associated (FHA) protein